MNQKQLAPASTYCGRCGYQLVGLSENRCPECGKSFDPADRRTYLIHPPVWGMRLWLRRLAIGLAASFVLLTIVLMLSMGNLYLQWKSEQEVIIAIHDVGGVVEVASEPTIWLRKCLGYRSRSQLLEVPPSYVPGLLGTRLAFLLDRVQGIMLSGAEPSKENPAVQVFFTVPVRIDDAWIERWIGQLRGLPALRGISLYSEQVTDAGMVQLEALPPNVSLTLCCPFISKQKLAWLKQARPNTVATLDTASQSSRRDATKAFRDYQNADPMNWTDPPGKKAPGR